MKKYLIFGLLVFSSQMLCATVRTYNYPPEVKPTELYKLKADGIPVLVMNTPYNLKSDGVLDSPFPSAIAAFEMEGAVDMEIECAHDVKWVDVRPLKSGIQAKIVAGKIKLTIPAPGNYSIEMNGDATAILTKL